MRHLSDYKLFEGGHEELPDVTVMLSSIDDDAYAAFNDYLTKYPAALGYEYCASGMHPLLDTINYFKYELREPEHSSVLLSVNSKGNLDINDILEWIRVNKSEMVERKLIPA